jgi:hypothetical protein
MSSSIEVQTTDVNGVAVQPTSVEIMLDGSSQSQPLQSASSGGVQSDITGAKKIKMHVTAKGYWDVTQYFDFADGDPPTVDPDGNQSTYNPYDYEINLDPPTFHTAATNDWIMTVHIRLSHLRDAESKVQSSLQQARDRPLPPPDFPLTWAQKFDTEMDFDLNRSVTTRLVQKWILGDEGATGTDRLNTTTAERAPGGTLYFLERVETPKLILVYMPPKANVIGMWYEEMPVPLNYNIFFHPAINSQWSDNPPGEPAYPFNFDSLNLPHRYLMGRPPQPDNPNPDQFEILYRRNKNKDMIKMLVESDAGVIFLFPVGSNAAWMGNITSQANALLLLQEVNHFVQRRAAAEVALHPIGRIGVSGFSFGYNGPAQLAVSKKIPDFDNNWDEIYNFDGNDASFVSPTIAWIQSRPDKRRLRIYAQPSTWDVIANMSPFNKAVKIQRFSAKEIDSYAGTIFHAPSGFWDGAFGVTDFDAIHQVIPALFLHHAFLRWFFV